MYLQEQGIEREQEREEFSREIARRQEIIVDLEKQVKVESRLKREVCFNII